MKSIALLGFALAMSPVLAAAQESPSPDAAAANFPHPSPAVMEQMHAQMEQLHEKARLAMLSSLTPAHRALLASVVGQLAIAPNPDRLAAAHALDVALSQSEQRSVLSVESSARAQSRSMMEASRTAFEASLTPEQRAEMQAKMQERMADRPARPENEKPPERTPDAGMTLLDLAMGGGDRHGFGHGGPGMGGPPPQ